MRKQIQDWNDLARLVGRYKYLKISPNESEQRDVLRNLEKGMKDYMVDYQIPFNPCIPPER